MPVSMIDIRQVPLCRLVQILNWYNTQPAFQVNPLSTLQQLVAALNSWQTHMHVMSKLTRACEPVLDELQSRLNHSSKAVAMSALTRYFVERTLLHATLFAVLVQKDATALLHGTVVSELRFLISRSDNTSDAPGPGRGI